jgi:toxin ParE1/3/4
MRLVFNQNALADIRDIYAWISYDSPAAAARVVMRLYRSIERLPIFPGLGHPGTDPGTRDWVVPRLPYLVVYEVRPLADELVILTILHQARGPSHVD